MEIEKLCRICLQASDSLQPIFGSRCEGVPLFDLFKRVCCNIKFIPYMSDTTMPNNLCSECVDVLSQAHKLSETSILSEIRLQALLPIDEPPVIKQEYVDFQVFVKNEGVESRSSSIEPLQEAYQFKSELIVEDEEASSDSSDSSDESYEKPRRKTSAPKQKNEAAKPKRKIVKRHQCPTCSKLFDKPSRLRRHQKTHDSEKRPFACEHPDCYQRFLTEASLQRHQIMHSGMTIKVREDKTFECIICKKNFHIQEALASHMKTHKDVMDTMTFPCNLCDQVFNKLNDLTRHRRKHPENKNHKCLICSKMFSQGSHLINHLNRHNNLRTHFCDICNKGNEYFKTRFGLNLIQFPLL
jgi:Zinc-finger associated domain (zf-AD)/C2H2-type zinc finger/Zinc finger, C2H2 type